MCSSDLATSLVNLLDDLLKLTTAQEIEIAVRLLLAAIFGLAVGYERRSADKPAGLRTLSLVCLGSAMFTIISAFGFETADQSRVAAQIVTGVGFLGAGARSEEHTSELQSQAYLVCRLLLEKKKQPSPAPTPLLSLPHALTL